MNKQATVINFKKEKRKRKFRINRSQLKLIAIISMLIDHIGAFLIPDIYAYLGYPMGMIPPTGVDMIFICRAIGRIAMPIFAFQIAEGFVHSKDVKAYLKRLGLFALLAEIPYDLLMSKQWISFDQQNILFSFFLAVLLMYWLKFGRENTIWQRIFIVAISGVIGHVLNLEYNNLFLAGTYVTPMIIVMTYIYLDKTHAKENPRPQQAFVSSLFNALQIPTVHIASLFIRLYNGKKGKFDLKRFYLIYPLQFVFFLICRLILLS